MNIVEALKIIVWYEGLEADLVKLKSAKESPLGCVFPNIPYDEWNEKIEFIWMILVLMFGNYGTSPRVGWIDADKFNDACHFIDQLI